MWTIVRFALDRDPEGYRGALDLLALAGFEPYRSPLPGGDEARILPGAVVADVFHDPAVVSRAIFDTLGAAGLRPVAVTGCRVTAPRRAGAGACAPRTRPGECALEDAMTLASHDDRRRFSRIVFHRPAELRTGTDLQPCEILDVSLKGALVETQPGFRGEIGAPCTLVIRLDAGEVTIQMEGAIVHRQGSQVGFRCAEIDLDSIAHLRRLVELNLGDEEVLHRELSALVACR